MEFGYATDLIVFIEHGCRNIETLYIDTIVMVREFARDRDIVGLDTGYAAELERVLHELLASDYGLDGVEDIHETFDEWEREADTRLYEAGYVLTVDGELGVTGIFEATD